MCSWMQTEGNAFDKTLAKGHVVTSGYPLLESTGLSLTRGQNQQNNVDESFRFV